MEQFERVPMPQEAEQAIMALAEQSTRYWPIGQWWVISQPAARGQDIFVTVEGYVTDFHEDRRVRARVWILSNGAYRAKMIRFWGNRHPSDWSSNK